MTGICSLVSVGQWTCIAEPSRLGRSECSCDRRLRWLKRQQGKRLTLLGLSFWGSKTFSQSRSPVSCLSCCRYARITSETGKSACEEICQTHCLSSQTLILARYLYPFEQLRERKNGPDHCVCARMSRRWFTPSLVWVPGIELDCQGWQWATLPVEPSCWLQMVL